MGKSNTEQTFPVVFSWCLEEDAASYDRFYKWCRREIYDGVPEPAVVLTDLSKGMTSAYDTLTCLPDSQLQYCTSHSIDAMDTHYKKVGRYNTEQQTLLRIVSSNYIYSTTLEDVEANRQQLLNLLQLQDYGYVTKV